MPDIRENTLEHCIEQARISLERARRLEPPPSNEDLLAVTAEWLKVAAEIEKQRALNYEGECVMDDSEYRQHAEECRVLARRAKTEEERSHLEQTAAAWEALAIERERLLRESKPVIE